MMTNNRYAQVYNAIIEYKQEHDGNSPTMRELIELTGYRSTSGISAALGELEAAGKIRLIGRGKSRSIEVVGARWLAPVCARCRNQRWINSYAQNEHSVTVAAMPCPECAV